MTLQEINDYFTKAYKKRTKKSGAKVKKDILTSLAVTIATYINEQPYKEETLNILTEKKPQMIERLYDLNYFGINDIKEMNQNYPNIFYALPMRVYNQYPELVDIIIDNKKVIYDLLPQDIRNNPKIQKEFKRNKAIYHSNQRDKNGFDTKWLDENGNIINFFSLLNGFPIKTRDDYLKIVNAYLKDNTSVPNFCRQYGIKNVEGFKSLLKRIGLEDTAIQKNIDINRAQAQVKYIEKTKKIAQAIDSDKYTFSEYIDNYYLSTHRFKLIFYYVVDKNKLVQQVIDYIMNNQQTLKIERLTNLMECDLNGLVNQFKKYLETTKMANSKIVSNLYSVINKYKRKYQRGACSLTIIKNGVTYEVNDKIIDQALVYIKNHNLYKCEYTVKHLCKEIALGNINYQEDTKAAKEELKNDILIAALAKAKKIEDYLDIMKNNKIR